MPKPVNISVKFILISLYVLCVFTANAGDQPLSEQACVSQDCSSASDPRLKEIISKRLDTYNQSIPQIYFIHLPNHDEWIASIIALEMLLGYQATSLDFEHPPELAQDLLFETVFRIQKMLFYGHSAAFLFKTGSQAVSKRDMTCVITMNPELIAKNAQTASRYMLAVEDEKIHRISPNRQLDGDNLLHFILDHEVAHCLDSYYNGANPMSMKDYWGQYMHFKREAFADIFAMANHIKMNGSGSPFIHNFLNYRRLCLINGNPGCCSADAIAELTRLEADKIMPLNIPKQLRLAGDIWNKVALSYDQFEDYYFASIEAMRLMNIDPDKHYKILDLAAGKAVDSKLVQKMINQTRKAYRLIFNETMK